MIIFHVDSSYLYLLIIAVSKRCHLYNLFICRLLKFTHSTCNRFTGVQWGGYLYNNWIWIWLETCWSKTTWWSEGSRHWSWGRQWSREEGKYVGRMEKGKVRWCYLPSIGQGIEKNAEQCYCWSYWKVGEEEKTTKQLNDISHFNK